MRVHAGRRQCSAQRVAHALSAADGLREHVSRCADLTTSFYCDICGVTLPTSALHRCVATAYARGAALHLLGRVASLHVAHLDSSSAFSLSGFGAPAALARRPLL